MRHANRKAARGPSTQTAESTQQILTFRGTVVRRSRAQHRRPWITAALAGRIYHPREGAFPHRVLARCARIPTEKYTGRDGQQLSALAEMRDI